jgi:hypothetical protein
VRARDANRQEYVEQVHAGEPDIVAPHHVAQHTTVIAHLEREHGAPGDLECKALNRCEQVDSLSSRRTQVGDRLLGWAEHVRGEQAHGLRRERRSEGAALVPPVRPFTHEEPCPNQRAQDAKGRPGTPIVFVVVHEHVLDGVRCVQDVHRPTEIAPLENFLLVGLARVRSDGVGPHAPGQLERTHRVGRGFRCGRNEPLRCCQDGSVRHIQAPVHGPLGARAPARTVYCKSPQLSIQLRARPEYG